MSSPATKKQEKIYVKAVKGKFRAIRWIVLWTLLGIYFLIPWIKIDGRPSFLMDIPARKFYVLGIIIWPQDIYILAFILILLAIGLFFFTAIAGRLWCGYGCPQSVFTDLFLWIERVFEGGRQNQIRLDKSKLTIEKAARKIWKHAAWITVSFLTAFTFVSYFVQPGILIERIVSSTLTNANIFWLALFTITTYWDCGGFREQMCIYVCPYGRFQGAMLDPQTLIIAYDKRRGEPRGIFKRGVERKTGGCVDCGMCVQACPTGIDIRNGLQIECIACAQCIDVCNSVMKKVGLAQGLIRYGAMAEFEGQKVKVLRPRVVAYAVILFFIASGIAYDFAGRKTMAIDIIRSRASLYNIMPDGRISNVYTIKAMNMDTKEHAYKIIADGLNNAEVVMASNPIFVKSGEVYSSDVYVITDKKTLDAKIVRFNFILQDIDNPMLMAKKQSTFFTAMN